MFPLCYNNPVDGCRSANEAKSRRCEGVLQPEQRAKVKEQTRYRGRTAKSERTRDSHLEVLADHSTDGQCPMAGRKGGEVRPKRPTAGKVKPGITFFW